MGTEVVGTVSTELSGTEFDCTSINPKVDSGRKLVPTMNSTGKARKTTKTVKSIMLSLEVTIEDGKDIDWDSVDDATVTMNSLGGGMRKTYIGCGVTGFSESYTVGSEAKRQIEMYALDVIEESV